MYTGTIVRLSMAHRKGASPIVHVQDCVWKCTVGMLQYPGNNAGSVWLQACSCMVFLHIILLS